MVYFIGAGPGDAELITLKGYRILQKADAVLYTGSLVPKEVLQWCKKDALIADSQKMNYNEIFEFFKIHRDKLIARVQTGEPTLFSTIAKQIEFLKSENIDYQIVSGVTSAFGASASLSIEYTIPAVSQTVILTRVEGKSPNPEPLENILACKNSSLVFYLSIGLIDKLIKKALSIGYSPNTPCWVVEKATWQDEKIYKGTIKTISSKVSHIKGIALILLGEFLYQKAKEESYLYR